MTLVILVLESPVEPMLTIAASSSPRSPNGAPLVRLPGLACGGIAPPWIAEEARAVSRQFPGGRQTIIAARTSGCNAYPLGHNAAADLGAIAAKRARSSSRASERVAWLLI